jgi:hypothetical protein
MDHAIGHRGTGRRGGDGASSRRKAVIAAVCAFALAVSGVVGWLVFGTRPGSSGGGAGAAGATGAVGAAAVRDSAEVPAGAVPAPYEAVGDKLGEVGQLLNDTARVIRTAELTVVIPRDSFEDRFAEATDIGTTNGGYVQDSRTRQRSGTVTVRVPADRFDATLRSLRALGDVDVQAIHGQDVTAQYVDLQARMRIATSRRQVLLRLMDRARTIEQTIRVQNALDETQLRIEEIQGQLRLLNDQTSLATITLSMREEGVSVGARAPSIVNAFHAALAGFVAVIAAVVVGLGYVIPIGVLAVVIWFVLRLFRRRRAAVSA